MTNPDYTHLAFVADASSSMHFLAASMNAAIAQVIKDQAEQPGELHVDVWRFADEVTHLYRDVRPDEVKGEIIVPNGNTALNDAIATAINSLGDRFAALPDDERPGKVIVAIVTDGMENASKEYARHSGGTERVKALLEEQKADYQWEFLFFGAESIDAFGSAAGYGIGQADTISFAASPQGVEGAAFAASGYMTRSRLGDVAGFSDEERRAAAGGEEI